jgi:hypothetical protein
MVATADSSMAVQSIVRAVLCITVEAAGECIGCMQFVHAQTQQVLQDNQGLPAVRLAYSSLEQLD